MTPLISDRKIASIDGLRAVAILVVMLSHLKYTQGFPVAWKEPAGYLFSGPTGVLIFFVISGFLITELLLREETKSGSISLRLFYIRRFLRLMPVYFLFILVVLGLNAVFGWGIPALDWVAMATYTRNFVEGHYFTTHFWSLAVEEQFYLLWPFLLIATPRRWRLAVALGLCVVGPVARVAAYFDRIDNEWLFPLGFFRHVDILMIGCALAFVLREVPAHAERVLRWRPAVGRLLAVVALLVPTALMKQLLFGMVVIPFGTVLQALAAAYLIASLAVVKSGMSYRILNTPLMAWVGVLSYSLYVWQQLFLAPTSNYNGSVPVWMEFPYVFVWPFVVAWVSYRFVEEPFLQLKSRFRQSTKGARPDPVVTREAPVEAG